MAKKELRRVRRARHQSSAEVASDEAIRRKVRAEFPPVGPEPLGNSLSVALKQAIRASTMSEYQIAKRAGISQIIVSRFLSGERDIRLATADKLAQALGMKLTVA